MIHIFMLMTMMVIADLIVGGLLHELPAISSENYRIQLDSFLANEWVEMTPLQSLNYYTKKEVCDVTRGDSNGKCDMFIAGDLEPYKCAISSSGFGHVNGFCDNTIGSFLKHKDLKDWPESENELDVIRMMREQGSNTIVMIGDSLTGQHMRNTYCNLIRVGAKLRPANKSWVKFSFFRGNSFEVSNPMADRTSAADEQFPYFQFILFYPLFHKDFDYYNETFHNLTEHVQNLPIVKGKVMYIYNFGLHYNHDNAEMDELALASTSVLIEASKQGHTLFFRETSAQHFHTPTGLYAHPEAVPQVTEKEKLTDDSPVKLQLKRLDSALMSTQEGRDSVNFSKLNATVTNKLQFSRCKRIESEEALDKQNWRNKRARGIINELDPTHEHIGTDNFYRVSAARNDLHMHDMEESDCTHFCLSPMLWAPTWDAIAKFYRKKHNI